MRRFPIVLTLALTSGCLGYRTVREDVYRAPQMHEDLLARKVEEHDIRSIVCLRGLTAGGAQSVRAAIGTDTTFVNVPMSATSLPPPATLLALWDVAENAERPMLLHCRAGVDRTGLASAIIMLHDTGDFEAARGQLAFVDYGHVPWFGTAAMDEVLDRYAPHAAAGMSFPVWVETVYAAEFAGRR